MSVQESGGIFGRERRSKRAEDKTRSADPREKVPAKNRWQDDVEEVSEAASGHSPKELPSFSSRADEDDRNFSPEPPSASGLPGFGRYADDRPRLHAEDLYPVREELSSTDARPERTYPNSVHIRPEGARTEGRAPEQRESLAAKAPRQRQSVNATGGVRYTPGTPDEDPKYNFVQTRGLNHAERKGERKVKKLTDAYIKEVGPKKDSKKVKAARPERRQPLVLERAFDKTPEQELQGELAALTKEFALNEQTPNSKAEYKEKLKALLTKYSPEENKRALGTGPEDDIQDAEFEDIVPGTSGKTGLPSGPIYPVPATQGPREVIVYGSYQSDPLKEYERKMEELAIVNRVGETSSQPMTAEQIQEAARIYQSGEMFTAGPKNPEITKEQMEEAARIYQGGELPAAPVTSLQDVKERAEKRAAKELSNKEFLKRDSELNAELKHRKDVYFKALAKHQRTRSVWDVTAERIGIKGRKDMDALGQLHLLKSGWIEIQAEKAKNQLDNIEARRVGRGGEKRQNAAMDAVRARYQKMYVVRQGVLGAYNEEQRERQGALDSRRRTVLDRVNKWYSGLDPKTKIAWGTTIGIGGFTFGAFLTGGLTGVAGAIAGTGAVAGAYGGRMRYRAQEAKERAEKALTNRDERTYRKEMKKYQKLSSGAKWFSPSGIGAWLTGRGVGKLQEKENTTASQKLDESTIGNLADKDYFKNLVESRHEAAAVLARNEKIKQTASVAGGFVAGVGAGAALGSLGHHIDSSLHTAPPAHPSTGGHTGPETAAAHAAPTTASEQNYGVGHEVSAHIKTPGEGADKLYEDLRGQLTEAYKNAAHRPPVVEKLLAYKTMDEFSRATGFERVVDGHIESSTLHMGDSLTVTPDGRSLVFLEAGTPHEALIHASSLDSAQGATGVHVLIQETPQHEAVVLSQQSGWLPARAYGAQPQAEAHQASTTSARGDAAGDAHIAELNRAQTVGRSAAQAVTRPAETKSESSAPHSELPPDAIQTGAEYARQHPN